MVSTGAQQYCGDVENKFHDLACRSEARLVVLCRVVNIRSNGNDAGRIDCGVTAVIVPLDIIEIDGVSDAGRLIEITDVSPQGLIVDEPAPIALEMTHVYRIKPHQGRK